VALRVFEALARVLPRSAALAIGAGMGRLAGALGIGRRIVAANFAHVSLGDEAQNREWIRALYRNMGRYVMDILRSGPGVPPYRLQNEHLIDVVREQGAIILVGHFGNFELLAPVFGPLIDLHVIVKPQHNPYVERWLDHKRRACGIETVYQKNAAKRALSVLRKKGALAALVDQNPGPDGAEAPFLGKPAQTVRAFAGLQDRLGVPALSVYALLAEDGVYDIVPELVTFEPSGDDDDRIRQIQDHHNEIIGTWVREHPDHWFGWFHRRFRPYLDYSRSD